MVVHKPRVNLCKKEHEPLNALGRKLGAMFDNANIVPGGETKIKPFRKRRRHRRADSRA
jgi:hypothetical protein